MFCDISYIIGNLPYPEYSKGIRVGAVARHAHLRSATFDRGQQTIAKSGKNPECTRVRNLRAKLVRIL